MDTCHVWSICEASLGLISFGVGWYFVHKILFPGRAVSWKEAGERVRNKVLTLVDIFGDDFSEVTDDMVSRPVRHLPPANIVGWLPRLPGELRSELGQMLAVKDLLSLSTANRVMYHAFWGNKQVWFSQYIIRDICFSTDLCDGIEFIRDAFRKSLFHVDMKALKSMKYLKPQSLMTAVTKTLSGMMLHDGPAMINLVYDLIKKALREYEPSVPGAQVVADELMCTVRARSDMLSQAEIEAIEDAFNDAQRLDNIMETAASKHLQSLLHSLGVNEPRSSRSTPCQPWDLACELLAESYRSSRH